MNDERLEQLLNTGYVSARIQLSALKQTVVNPVQLVNAQSPMDVTELGIEMVVSPIRP